MDKSCTKRSEVYAAEYIKHRTTYYMWNRYVSNVSIQSQVTL